MPLCEPDGLKETRIDNPPKNEPGRMIPFDTVDKLKYSIQMLSRDLNIRLSVVYLEMWMDVQRIDLFEDIERTVAGVAEYATGHIHGIGEPYKFLATVTIWLQ